MIDQEDDYVDSPEEDKPSKIPAIIGIVIGAILVFLQLLVTVSSL